VKKKSEIEFENSERAGALPPQCGGKRVARFPKNELQTSCKKKSELQSGFWTELQDFSDRVASELQISGKVYFRGNIFS
jgi:hypothetical protein